MALAKGLVPSLLSQAAARAAEPLAHITRTLVQLEVIDHDVGQTALSNYLKNCLAKSKGISGPSYNPANGSHTLHRHIAAAVPVASLLKVRGKELLSALHRTREEPEAAPSYTELQASADASAAAARREQQRSSQLRAQVKTLQEVSVNAVRLADSLRSLATIAPSPRITDTACWLALSKPFRRRESRDETARIMCFMHGRERQKDIEAELPR